MALVFALGGLTFTIGSVVFGILSEHGQKSLMIQVTFILSSISIYICGGLNQDLPAELTITYAGMCIWGFFCAGNMVPVMPLVIDLMEE